MDINKKFELITKQLVLEKEKKHLELERYINTNNLDISNLCEEVTNKLNEYRSSTENLNLWLELIEPEVKK
jgi:hypothetical protein|tara:strand:+ start:699 stop:911 length:213 start_codon:yes stop_codon:yes gene_type:complete